MKSYRNEMLTGNSRMLATADRGGALLRIFWPSLSSKQLLDSYRLGVCVSDGTRFTDLCLEGNTQWQGYLPGTNISVTEKAYRETGISAKLTDFVLISEDVLVRKLDITNLSGTDLDICVLSLTSIKSYGDDTGCTVFDYMADAAVHYIHGSYFATGFNIGADRFVIGNEPEFKPDFTAGHDDTAMLPGILQKKGIGSIKHAEMKSITQYICFGLTYAAAVRKFMKYKTVETEPLLEETALYWKRFVEKSIIPAGLRGQIREIYERSVLLFPLVSDTSHGGILASPEFDEGFTKCGRYGYCWCRDAVFITAALDACGLYEISDKFFDWAAVTQETDGSWRQRYHTDGNLAPSWGFQADETGAVISGLLSHYMQTGNIQLLSDKYEMIRKAADFLCGFTDPLTGLPGIGHDIWEERKGIHAYTCAAIYAGLMAAASIAGNLGIDQTESENWRVCAARLKDATRERFWKEDYDRYIRSVLVKLNPFGKEPSDNTVMLVVTPKGAVQDFTPEDWKFDISLLGLSYPFGMLDTGDRRMAGTVKFIEQTLRDPVSGNYYRYENDTYMGGNPWVLATLWAGLFHLREGNINKAQECLESAAQSATAAGFLPEQALRDTGEPVWGIPLTWSHAMFVLLAAGLYNDPEERT